MAPGSRVVTDYLEASGLMSYLEQLGFHIVGYGCTTCIGNSGPIPEKIAKKIDEGNLVSAAVLSGNRNFEGRINPLVKANYLASPPLVIAYAIAGTVDIDLTEDPVGTDSNGQPVYLKDIWPDSSELSELIRSHVDPKMFTTQYDDIFKGTELWDKLNVPEGKIYEWDPASTYIREPPFFKDLSDDVAELKNISDARVLALLGDTITTDHISPAGAIPTDGPAGLYLRDNGVEIKDFNSFGSRRGNHEVMMRGTFGNIRLINKLADGKEGGWTRYLPSDEIIPLYDAAMKYQENGIPLVVIAGKEYGTGSSRDWAAKGTFLLGVKAVIAESYERIHRSNLVGMGVLPLQFKKGESADSLGLKGDEHYDISGITELKAGSELAVKVKGTDGSTKEFMVDVLLNSTVEVDYYCNGGILHKFIRTKLD
jgi:aconitate hydratase